MKAPDLTPEVRYLVDHINASDLIPGGPPGPWVAFQADPGWVNDLRYRTIAPGVQFEGSCAGVVGANARARVGVLPVGFRPRQALRIAGVAGMGLSIGFAMFEIGGVANSEVWIVGSLGDGSQTVFFSLSTVFGVD